MAEQQRRGRTLAEVRAFLQAFSIFGVFEIGGMEG